MSKKVFQFKKINKIEWIGSLILMLIFVLPMLSLAGEKKIYVNNSASTTGKGTKAQPYKTIKEAIKKADKDDEIHVAAGTYRENIEIPKGVELYGENEKNTIIVAKNDDDPTIKMNHKTKINKFTVKGGNNGIEIKRDARASIVKCIIKNNKSGIYIKEAKVEDKYYASISESVIEHNERAGIFSEKRRIILVKNKFNNNEKDGAILSAETSAWIDDNEFKNNEGSGMKVSLDGSNIWTDDNVFSNNDREGIEINAYGKPGKIDLKDSKFTDNDKWGIALIKRGNFLNSVFNGVVIHNNNKFWENKNGNVSHIIQI